MTETILGVILVLSCIACYVVGRSHGWQKGYHERMLDENWLNDRADNEP